MPDIHTLHQIYFMVCIALFGGTFIYLASKIVGNFISNIRWRMRRFERLNERLCELEDAQELANKEVHRKLVRLENKIKKSK